MEETETPHVDPRSPARNLKVSRAYLEQRLGGARSEVLRGNYVGESPSGKYFWFRDVPEVRQELGMEANSGEVR